MIEWMGVGIAIGIIFGVILTLIWEDIMRY